MYKSIKTALQCEKGPRLLDKTDCMHNPLRKQNKKENFVLNDKSYFRRGHYCASPILRTATNHTSLIIECEESPEEECTTAIKRQGTLKTATLLIKFHLLVAEFIITVFATNIRLKKAITLHGTESKSLQLHPLRSASESEL